MKLVNNCLYANIHGVKTNPPIVFVHGFPFDSDMWLQQTEALKEKYYVISYDVRGLGKSYVGDGQYTMEAYVNDLLALIAELGLKTPAVCGLSMGGYIALRAYEKAPSKFGSLILCDTKSEADDDETKIKRAGHIDHINLDGLPHFVNSFIPPCFTDKSRKSLAEYEEILERASNGNPEGVKGAVLAMLSRTDTTKALKKIKIPVLVVCGAQDKHSTPEQMQAMAKKIDSCKFVTIPKAAHMAPVENPKAFNSEIVKFLEGIKK